MRIFLQGINYPLITTVIISVFTDTDILSHIKNTISHVQWHPFTHLSGSLFLSPSIFSLHFPFSPISTIFLLFPFPLLIVEDLYIEKIQFNFAYNLATMIF